MTDGREHIHHAIDSFLANAYPLEDVTELWIHDDSGDIGHADDLAARYAEHGIAVMPFHERRGFGGAIQTAWRHLRAFSEAEFVFHLEDDFVFNRGLNLLDMQDILGMRPNLAQIALRRQPWNDDERRAGGIVEQHPESYEEMTFYDLAWLEHDRFFTTNPCMYRAELMRRKWPDGAQSEGRFGVQLKEVGKNFAYLGERASTPWVHHIGDERAGKGY